MIKINSIGKRLNEEAGPIVTEIMRDLLKYGHPYPSDQPAIELLRKRRKAAFYIKMMRRELK